MIELLGYPPNESGVELNPGRMAQLEALGFQSSRGSPEHSSGAAGGPGRGCRVVARSAWGDLVGVEPMRTRGDAVAAVPRDVGRDEEVLSPCRASDGPSVNWRQDQSIHAGGPRLERGTPSACQGIGVW